MTQIAIHLVVADPDVAATWYADALGARETNRVTLPDARTLTGATVFEQIHDAFWGDRTGQFLDPYGHRWALDEHVRDVPRDEIEARAAELFSGSATA
ncbi:hypothetical protein N5079_17605 [Planotetraspora sp. A-T 1434]|uniref:VOC family protein n=1 Tax=Planotetraspora sp. A-T 1434 TaxID=2979219 RepID=UPI0021BF9FBA|nr:hypothetical protein [Planotetraspora sp. A-T 1434]MCT9932020.1 hypothetical protein [Planotetraspora sp. A-T 1434]